MKPPSYRMRMGNSSKPKDHEARWRDLYIVRSGPVGCLYPNLLRPAHGRDGPESLNIPVIESASSESCAFAYIVLEHDNAGLVAYSCSYNWRE